MPKPSTTDIVRDLLEHVAPRFRTIRDVAAFQEAVPHRTVVVHDEISDMQMGLSEEFTEHRLYLMDGSAQLATINLAFHCDQGLVNFSFLVLPREWFKRKAIMNAVRTFVFPYLREHYPNAPMVPQTQDVYLFPDDDSGITFQLRAYTHNPDCVGIGVAMIDSDHV